MYLLNAMDIPHPRPATVPVPPPMKGAPATLHMMMPVQHIAEDLQPYELMEHKAVASIPIPFTWKKVGHWVLVAAHSLPSHRLVVSSLPSPPTHRQTQTHTDTQTDRQTDTHTHTHTHIPDGDVAAEDINITF